MSRTKKILLGALLGLLVLLVVAYFVTNSVLDSVSRQALASVSHRGLKHGIEIKDPNFVNVSLTGLRSARWSSLLALLRFPDSNTFDPNRVFEVRAEHLDMSMAGGGQVRMNVQGLHMDSTIPGGDQDGAEFEGLSKEEQEVTFEKLSCLLDWELFKPKISLEENLPTLVQLITTGTAPLGLDAQGTIRFILKEKPIALNILVVDKEQGRALTLEPADVEKLSKLFSEKLTPAEVEIVAKNPLRAPDLLRIKDDAESTAESAANQDPTVPQDAYRHVLWSFLLTNQYGTEFAEQVTSAHEEGDTGNTTAERDMDLHNNSIGRQYAEEKVNRKHLLKKLLRDEQVIRSAE